MSLNAATIALLIEKGLGAQDILDVARATEVKADPTNAARQARHRAKRRNAVTVTEAPPNDIYSNPQEEITTGAKAPSVTKKSVQPVLFVCPEGVDPAHWRDFLANRKRKHCAQTETAYQGILGDLARHADADWPPGRLVQHAAAKGWASINDPRTLLGHHQNGRQLQPSLRGTRPNPALDMRRRAAAQEAAERQDAEADRGSRIALPASLSGGP